jgi:hypothetical protein
MEGACSGRATDHCCYLGGGVTCRHLEQGTVPGRRWACALRRELGSWKAVHVDARYRPVREAWDRGGIMVDCGDWPPAGVECGACGVTGG